jgi:hypothetical protein
LIKNLLILILLTINCKNPPCSVLDSSCNPIGYIIPNLIFARNPNTTQTQTSNTNQFPITAFGGPRDIIINWTAQTGATSYRIYRKSSASVTGADTEITNGGTTNLTFMETALNDNTPRFYRVSFVRNGTEIFSNEASANANLTNLGLFLKADSLNQADNTPVVTWSDSSGNGYDATQATAGQRPLFRSNVLNGLPVIRFDGTDDFLAREIASPLLTNGTDQYNQTNFLVIKRNSIVGVQHIFTMKPAIDNSTGSNQIIFDTVSGGVIFHGSTSVFSGAELRQHINTTNFFIISLRARNEVAQNYNGMMYRNGSLVSDSLWVSSSTAYRTGSQFFRIGRNIDTPANQFNGDIAELIHYNRLMTETEHNQVVCYLSKKYNIATTVLTCN